MEILNISSETRYYLHRPEYKLLETNGRRIYRSKMEEGPRGVEAHYTLEQKEKAIESLVPDKNVTEEEFQNFMHRVTEIEKIVKKLASSDVKEQEYGKLLADEILESNVESDISEIGELKVKTNRTVINKFPTSEEETDPNKMSKEAFMKSMEKDAKARAEDRKIRMERAETLKRIGNGAFKRGDYEKAVTYYTKAVEQRKDSTVLWNNRALSYMQLGLYEKALLDCEWALKVNGTNLKALLNSAKCHKRLRNMKKCEEFIKMAREENPHLTKYIDEFMKNLMIESDDCMNQILNDD